MENEFARFLDKLNNISTGMCISIDTSEFTKEHSLELLRVILEKAKDRPSFLCPIIKIPSLDPDLMFADAKINNAIARHRGGPSSFPKNFEKTLESLEYIDYVSSQSKPDISKDILE